jgi:hypothetical protein
MKSSDEDLQWIISVNVLIFFHQISKNQLPLKGEVADFSIEL